MPGSNVGNTANSMKKQVGDTTGIAASAVRIRIAAPESRAMPEK
jgi:hypothetical protein